MDNKQYYEAYAKEIYALYASFRDAGFDWDQSFELVKICITNHLKHVEERERKND